MAASSSTAAGGVGAANSTTTDSGSQPPSTTANSQSTRTSSTHPSHSHNVPLSARRSDPLDLSTVERRGQPNAPREPVQRVRPHGIQEAPTFRPTEEEFKDPLAYIEKIAPEGRKFGICRVIPPDNWQPSFAVDTERFHFKTRRQELNSIEGGTRANLNYLDQLAKFHQQHGTNLNRFPSVDKRPLDLYKLKKAVETRGGFDAVCRLKKWAEIGRDLGYSGKIMSSLSTSLKNSYQRWLQPYEEYLRVAKPGVQQQLELEQGGPFTPSPRQSPMNRKPSFDNRNNASSKEHLGSPAISVAATEVNNATKKMVVDGTPNKQTPPVEPAPSQPTRSGFTAVNQTQSSVAVNNGFAAVKCEADNNGTPTTHVAEHPPISTPTTNGHGTHPLKRTMSHDSIAASSQAESGEGDGGSGRRSKRIKKDAPPTVAGSHMTLLRPAPPREQQNGNAKIGEKCENCGKSDDRSSILLCDSCELGYHKSCLDPPVTHTPEYDWHCPKCLVGTGEFGFEEGGTYSLKQFQERADIFKKSYFASKMPFDPVINSHKRETEDDVEREFWRLVESLTETVEVEYGADIHSTTHGSGFPTIERNPLDPYSVNPWNLNVLPFYGDSLFRHIKTDISGMTVPWVYVGMCFSTFCWHNEDHYAYSANYQHFGATKTWYGIPGADAEAFETAMRQAIPELFEGQPDLLFQLVTLMPPDQLKKAGVNVYALDQRAEQFVITFPQAYHAGFNHGFNFNEAVNFAPADWEPFGAAGAERLQAFRRQPCFSHDELLVTAATRDPSISTAKWLAPALDRTCERELRQREEFIARHKEVSAHNCKFGTAQGDSAAGDCQLQFAVEETDLPEEDYQCLFCKAYTFLTQFRCHKTGKTLCLSHVETYDCCGDSLTQRLLGPDHALRCRMSSDALKSLAEKVRDRSRIPEAWGEKLDKVLEDEPKPQLKVLHNLLSEGEKIPYHLPGLHDLAEFVQRCDKWVEEANNYITRKQQNRKKNEKAWRKGSSIKVAQLEERDREVRRVENLHALLAEADKLSFDCPQMAALEEKTRDIEKFRQDVSVVLMNPHLRSIQDVEDLMEAGHNFNIDMTEVESLEHVLRQMKWNDQASRKRKKCMTLKECQEIILAGEQLGLSDTNNRHLLYFKNICRHGETWEAKAKELMSVEVVHYQQLEALSTQASRFPVSPETFAAVDTILIKQREVQRRIQSLYERSMDPDFRKRPLYKEVRETMESLEELNSRPTGAVDLEREQKRHEDWMRKGKKLFGKANAPLHILKSHMEYVEQKNLHCFDLEDRCRPPVEPSSRDNTPESLLESHNNHLWGGKSKKRDVFCLCRQSEAGMMIECEICHEWYHGKCLKIARGRVKEFDKYTCPICDWRRKIPRDAARPKLEDLQEWQAEISTLPFQPDEEQTLENIIYQASTFRVFLQSFTNAACTTTEEVPTLIFYLRKIEGAEVLLTYETNFFRQEIHKWAPVAPEPPPILEHSLSTRKPRPKKHQKIMAQLGVDRLEDLPTHLRPKQTVNHPKRMSMESLPAPQTSGNSRHYHYHSHSESSGSFPTMANMPGTTHNQPYPFIASYPVTAPVSTPSFAPPESSAFLPHAAVHSPSFPVRSPSLHHQGLDTALFSPPRYSRAQNDGPPVMDEGSNPFGSSPRANLDDVFADLTNQDAEPEQEPEQMENTHANEALEVLDASNAENHAGPVPDDGEERGGGSAAAAAAAAGDGGANGVVNGRGEGPR